MPKYLLDTTALIEYMRGRHEVVDFITTLARDGHRLGVCCINIGELYAGLGPSQRTLADQLIDNLETYEVTRHVAKEAGRYRYDSAGRGVTLTMADALIAATAVEETATLITANVRDFPMEGLLVMEHP